MLKSRCLLKSPQGFTVLSFRNAPANIQSLTYLSRTYIFVHLIWKRYIIIRQEQKNLHNNTSNAVSPTKEYANIRNLLRWCTLNAKKYYILVR